MAMEKLTKAYIEGFELPEDGPILIRDTVTTGFGIKFSKTVRTYYAERKVHGKTKRVTIGRHGALTLSKARKEAQTILGTLAKGIDVTLKRRKEALEASQYFKKSNQENTTLKEAYQAFLDSSERKQTTLKKYDRAIFVNLKSWQDTPISQITADMVATKHKALIKKSPAEGNHTMRVLRAVFNHAMETIVLPNGQYLINRNPVARLSKTKAWAKVVARTNYIKSHQIKSWWQAVEQEPPTLQDYLKFVLLTGVRRENASSLRWDDIDFEDRSFNLLAKNKDKEVPLPLSNYLLSLLEKRKQQSPSTFIFPSSGKTGHLVEPRKAYMRIQEKTGIEASIHDLRRSFAHYAAELAIPYYIVKRLMLHSLKGDVTQEHYTQHSIEQLRGPSQRIEDFIMNHISQDDNVVQFSTSKSKTLQK